MEEAETRYAQQRKDNDGVKHTECVFILCLRVVEYPVSYRSTEHDNRTINQENAPVW